MRQRFIAQVIKELLLVLRDPKSRMVLIGPPLMQLFVFAFAATLEVERVAVAVMDQDTGRWSQELVSRVAATELVRELIDVRSGQALERALSQRQALLAVRIPADFSRRVDAGEAGQIQVVLDGRSANAGQIALGYLEAIVGELNADVTLHVNVRRPARVVTVTRHWFNQNLEYLWFTVPSLVGRSPTA